MPAHTRLTDLLHSGNATVVEIAGRQAAASFGDIEAEYRAITTGVAILDRTHMGRVLATGGDALDLINRFSTNDTVSLTNGDVAVTVLTTDTGRIFELVTVVKRSESESLIVTGPGAEQKVVDWLDRYNFGEDCELMPVTDSTAQITLAGPGAPGLGQPLPLPGRSTVTEIDGITVEIVRAPGPSMTAWEVIVGDAGSAGPVWDALARAGAVPAGEEAFNIFRIESGVPAAPGELNGSFNPLEAGLWPYVSFTKGCYMGQEVIARLDTYGKLQRRLVGLVTDACPVPGTELRSGGRVVGEVTSPTPSPRLGRAIALAYVRKGYAEPGVRLEYEHGIADVVELPFAPTLTA